MEVHRVYCEKNFFDAIIILLMTQIVNSLFNLDCAACFGGGG